MRTLARTGHREEILRRLNHLRPESTALWGRMTASQMVCHLNDSFRAGVGERHASLAMNLFTRTVMKWGALYVPMRWPKGVPTRPEMDQLARGTPPTEFERDRGELHELIVRFTQPEATTTAVHPIFGRMSRADWMRWGYLHTDHHLRQFGV